MALLSPRDLATALGVSESSLKRWVDRGQIRAIKTAGGHRRIALEDALAFVERSGVPVARPELLGIGAAQRDRTANADDGADGDALYRALIAGDAAAVHREIAAHGDSAEELAALCDGPVRRAMYTVGELWRHDPDGVLVEHRATDACVQALAAIRAQSDRRRGPIALGGAPEDDPYVLPTAMAALVLAAAGFRAINLGPDTPTATLHRAVDRERPVLVWISVTAPLPVAQAHEVASFASGLPAKITGVVGGQHRAQIAAADPAVRIAGSMAELLAIARARR